MTKAQLVMHKLIGKHDCGYDDTFMGKICQICGDREKYETFNEQEKFLYNLEKTQFEQNVRERSKRMKEDVEKAIIEGSPIDYTPR